MTTDTSPHPDARRARRRPSARTWLITLSLLVHAAFGLGIGSIEAKKLHAASAIEITEAPKKLEPPPSAKVEAPPEEPVKARSVARNRPAAAPPPDAPPRSAPAAADLDALPDFGLSLSGGVTGSGMALPAAGAGRATGPTRPASVQRALRQATAEPGIDGCAEPPAKPRPKSVPQPVYTDAARAAGVEGKVRVELTVDESGRVTAVRVLSGLGHGLDEAALAAARRAEFDPASRCGRPVRATFTISMRFTAG